MTLYKINFGFFRTNTRVNILNDSIMKKHLTKETNQTPFRPKNKRPKIKNTENEFQAERKTKLLNVKRSSFVVRTHLKFKMYQSAASFDFHNKRVY